MVASMHSPCDSILDAIGHTPLVALHRFCAGLDGLILMKIEFLNPGFSKKDRIAYQMIRGMRESGRLAPGHPVIELTSGNTGTGLAMVCAVLGHPFIAVMSAGNSMERARMMAALGAEVVLVPQAPGSRPGQVSGDDLALVERRTQELVKERGAFRADQFLMEENVMAHRLGTGAELWTQSKGKLSAFVDFVGSGGTFTGVAQALKERNPRIQCYAVEPAGAALLAGEPVTNAGHRIQGGGYARTLPLFDYSVCDGFLKVDDRQAIEAARRLARSEGIFAGFSTGANLAAAVHLFQGPYRGGTVACLACDSALKYLSTDLFP